MNKRRVVITGMGLITPIGNTAQETWASALEGRSGGNLIEHFDTSDFSVKIGANVKNFDVEQYLDRKEARRIDVFIQLGIAAGVQAIDDAGIADMVESDRVGIAIGSGIGGINTIEDTHSTLLKSGITFLRARQCDQYDFRQFIDSIWISRAEYRDRHCLYDRYAQHWVWGADDPAW